MYPLEILLVVVLLVLLVAQNVRGISRNVSLACFAIGLFIMLLGALVGQARWQMATAYLLFVILSLLLLKRSYSHVILRSIGIALGALLLGIGVMVSLALPIVTLPAPDGPHVVGSRLFSLTDESRNEAYFGAPDERRELYLQVWYPGTITRRSPHLPSGRYGKSCIGVRVTRLRFCLGICAASRRIPTKTSRCRQPTPPTPS